MEAAAASPPALANLCNFTQPSTGGGAVSPLSSTPAPGSHILRLCDRQTYCLNGGTCHVTVLGDLCVCVSPYRGPRCEQFDFSILGSTQDRDLNILLPAAVLGAVAFFALLLLLYVFVKKQMELKRVDDCPCGTLPTYRKNYATLKHNAGIDLVSWHKFTDCSTQTDHLIEDSNRHTCHPSRTKSDKT